MELEIISEKPQGNPKSNPILFVHGAWNGAWCWQPYFLPYFAFLDMLFNLPKPKKVSSDLLVPGAENTGM